MLRFLPYHRNTNENTSRNMTSMARDLPPKLYARKVFSEGSDGVLVTSGSGSGRRWSGTRGRSPRRGRQGCAPRRRGSRRLGLVGRSLGPPALLRLTQCSQSHMHEHAAVSLRPKYANSSINFYAQGSNILITILIRILTIRV